MVLVPKTEPVVSDPFFLSSHLYISKRKPKSFKRVGILKSNFMKTKIVTLGIALTTTALAAVFVMSCKKETSNLPTQNSAAVAPSSAREISPNGLPTPTIDPQIYLAESNVTDPCTGPPGPIARNSELWGISNLGPGQITIYGQSCYLVASAFNKADNKIYVCTRNQTSGQSDLYWADALGLHYVNALVYNNTPFYVNEMEFDDNGVLYLLKNGSDRGLYSLTNLSGTISFIGNMFGVHQAFVIYKEALAFSQGVGMYLVYETSSTSGTKSSLINLSTAVLGSATNHSIPNCFTNNLSAFYDPNMGGLYFIRDNGTGSASMYDASGTLVPNTLTCRPSHDATARW